MRKELVSCLLLSVLAGGCGQGSVDGLSSGSTGGISQVSGDSSLPSSITALSLQPAPGELVAPPTPTPGSKPLLNEVVFIPADRLQTFVEIKLGTTDMGPLKLRNQDGQEFDVPTGTGLILVSFASNPDFLNSKKGSVTLLAGNTVLDTVAWGDLPEAVQGGLGAVRPLGAGDALIRTPQSTGVGPGFWFIAAMATPGSANPAPRVSALFPLSGTLTLPGQRLFSWYPLAGATNYRVQIADNRNFTTPLLDQTLDQVALNFNLAVGDYYWRVQAIYPNGALSNFTPPAHIRVIASAAELNPRTIQPRVVRSLEVPLLKQRKDTHLLLLESVSGDDNVPPNGHPWNAPHEDHRSVNSITDPACEYNCVIASLVMVNRFYGGTLSQDRLSYEIFHDRPAGTVPNYTDGPERDFQFGDGVLATQFSSAMTFALGGAGAGTSRFQSKDSFWEIVKAEIDAGRPLLMNLLGGAGPVGGHCIVVTGYIENPNDRVLMLNNPWEPSREFLSLNDIPPVVFGNEAVRLEIPNSIDANLQLLPSSVSARRDEASITTDTDQDGLMDFDEARFGTNPNNKDSDNDCIDDREEVATTMYHASTFGPPIAGVNYYNQVYFTAYLLGHGDEGQGNPLASLVGGVFQAFGADLSQTTRDPDGDRLRSELDQNSDKGVLPDFLEDDNRNGKLDSGETSPLVEGDDRLQIAGTVTEDTDVTGSSTNPGGQILTSSVHTTLKLKYTYDIKVEGKSILGGVNVEESNGTSFNEQTRSADPIRITLEQTIQPRQWMSAVRLNEWYCDFFETGVEHDSLTFQLFNSLVDDSGPLTPYSLIETDYFMDGTNRVFDRSSSSRSRVFPLLMMNFTSGRMNTSETVSGKTRVVDLTVHH